MEHFPFGYKGAKKDRQTELVTKENRSSLFTKTGSLGHLVSGFDWKDSPLVEGYGDISSTFAPVLPEGAGNIKEYIEITLETREGNAVGVEFGGVGANLFSGFTPGFFKQTAGITLTDPALKILRPFRKKPETHEVLYGDITKDETYKSLQKLLGGKKVDLIIERMAGGLRFLPQEPFRLIKVLQTWYQLLNEGGIMFVQTPEVFDGLLLKWKEYLQNGEHASLETQFDFTQPRRSPFNTSIFRLRKLPGAPLELPLLDARVVRDTQKSKS